MLLLTLRDLQYRRSRVVTVTLLVALLGTLLFLMTGLVNHLKQEPHDAVAGIGARWWVLAEGVSGPFTATSVVPAEAAAAVERGAPLVVARATLTDGDGDTTQVIVIGFRPGGLGRPDLAGGRDVAGPGELVVSDTLDTDLGSSVSVGGTTGTVVGSARRASVLAGVPFVFMELGQAQDVVFGRRDVVSAVISDAPAVEGPAGSTVVSARDVGDDALEPLDSAISSIDLIRVLLWIVTGIVLGGVIYLSALERRRDFSVLKAIGTKDRHLGAGLVIQAVVIALVGVGAAALLQRLVEPVFPLEVAVPPSAYWRLPLLAVVIAALVGSLATRQITRVEPAAAFGGPAT